MQLMKNTKGMILNSLNKYLNPNRTTNSDFLIYSKISSILIEIKIPSAVIITNFKVVKNLLVKLK